MTNDKLRMRFYSTNLKQLAVMAHNISQVPSELATQINRFNYIHGISCDNRELSVKGR